MCGLSGFSWTNDCILDESQKQRLLHLSGMGNDKRGGQSHGVLTINDNSHNIHRGLGPVVAADFQAIAKATSGYLHSRFATSGSITVKNQHPFRYGNVIGAHNGVIYNAKELDKLYGKKVVDSEHIFDRISQGKNLNKFNGYGVIEWFDITKPNTIFLCNIGDGDLALFKIRGVSKSRHSGYFWTSDDEDGRLALAGAGLKEADYDEYTLTKGMIYTFKHGALGSVPNLTLKVRSTQRPARVWKPYRSNNSVVSTLNYSNKVKSYDWYNQYRGSLWDKYDDSDNEEMANER